MKRKILISLNDLEKDFVRRLSGDILNLDIDPSAECIFLMCHYPNKKTLEDDIKFIFNIKREEISNLIETLINYDMYEEDKDDLFISFEKKEIFKYIKLHLNENIDITNHSIGVYKDDIFLIFNKNEESNMPNKSLENSLKLFQIRLYDDKYSVVYNHDLGNDKTNIYEHRQLIKLSYNYALEKALEFEEEYKTDKSIINLKEDSNWILIDVL